MKEEGDYLLVCTAFAAGIVSTGSFASWPLPYQAAATSAFLHAAAICLAAIITVRQSRPLYLLMFCFLGAFCRANESMCIITVQGGPLPAMAGRVHAWFCTSLESIAFDDARTPQLLKAMMCGDRTGLDPEVKRIFRQSGAAHLLALSGLHLGIIYSIVAKVIAPLGNSRMARMAGSAATIAFCGFYTAMTGSSPSTVRAFIFICANEFSKLADGRSKRPVRLLLTAFVIQLAVSPHILGSIGFQMSYLATMGICTLFPRLSSWYPAQALKYDPMRRIWNGMALAISCQIFTAPASWLYFHSFPKFFLLTNIIAIPLATALISLAAMLLALNAFGLCPMMLVRTADMVSGLLLKSLEIISSM